MEGPHGKHRSLPCVCSGPCAPPKTAVARKALAERIPIGVDAWLTEFRFRCVSFQTRTFRPLLDGQAPELPTRTELHAFPSGPPSAGCAASPRTVSKRPASIRVALRPPVISRYSAGNPARLRDAGRAWPLRLKLFAPHYLGRPRFAETDDPLRGFLRTHYAGEPARRRSLVRRPE